MGTTTTEIISSGFDWSVFIGVMLVLGVPALVLLGFGIWAMRKQSGGAVQAVGIALTALGVILAVFTIGFLTLGGVFYEVVGETTIIENVP
ncbi:MAG: hypothetical protein F4Y49_06075 [Dehalococcoidia bacterium]|nr:hypothetical protein [Dehalococcoidia bacterium]